MEPTAAPPPGGATLALASLRRRLPSLELGAAWLLSLLAGGLHLSLFLRHYPFWRDEVNTLQLATLPRVADTWKYLPYDSVPLLIHGMVRAWVAVMPVGDGDSHLRLLGCLIGLGIIGAFWICVRTLGGRAPLLSLTLLGFNPLFIRYGDSNRGYGLGTLLAILTFAAVWRVVREVRPGRVLWAMTVGVLSVQALFYNAVLLLAVCAAGALVATGERNARKAALLLGIGLPAALSLVPYAAMFQEQHRWSFLLYYPVTAAWLWKKVSELTGAPDPLGVWVWTAMFVGLVASGARRLRGDRVAAFAWFTLTLGTVSYALFLRVLDYPTQPWYYVALLGLAAVCLDALFARLLAGAGAGADWWRAGRLAFLLSFSTLTFGQTAQALHQRPTNLDRVAARVARSAAPEDLIVHTRWECAVPFGHYYRGTTPQMTLPPLTDHRFHRYDLVLAQMQTANAEAPTLDRMARTLQAGHRVWVVGNPISTLQYSLLPIPRPPSATRTGPVIPGRAYAGWFRGFSGFLRQHVLAAVIIDVPTDEPISPYENLPLTLWQGWRDDAPPTPDAP